MIIDTKSGTVDVRGVSKIVLDPLKGVMDIIIQTDTGIVTIACYGKEGEKIQVVEAV